MDPAPPCEQCNTPVEWDHVHRIEYEHGKELKLCSACCPNCFKDHEERS